MNNDKLKFRAWCEKLKSYAPLEGKISFPGNIVLEPVVISADGRVFSCNPYGGVEQCELDDMTEYFIIEHCTGLKDKHGKLIYEGDVFEADVLNSYDGDNLLGKRIRGQVAHYTDGACFTFAAYAPFNLGQIEIVGNIHEMENEND